MAIRRNVEIKARCPNPENARVQLRIAGARYVGHDHQRDTYFLVGAGRLKLREGLIENALIAYSRVDEAGPKVSDVRLFRGADLSDLREVLLAALTVDIVVEKERHIFFLDNIKIHIDSVPQLGHFVEIEAIDADGARSVAELDAQCRIVMQMLDVHDEHLVSASYSDLLRARRAVPRWC